MPDPVAALRAKIKVCMFDQYGTVVDITAGSFKPDRRMRPFGITPHQPDIVVPDMKGLADALLPA